MKTTKCQNCGAEIPQNFIVCPHCQKGVASQKKRKTAMNFAWTLGFVGAHNFYMGFYGKATLQASVFALGVVFLVLGLCTNVIALTACGIVIFVFDFVSAILQGVFLYQKKWSRDKFGKKLLEPLPAKTLQQNSN